ncbi:MAG: hypothetical protein JW874_01825 [Spirochaetales bacterium]|nr:hypothetical protein [Spirochaetales bacterium]
MKNYLIVINSITACLLFGTRFFSQPEAQGLILLCWLVYLVLILLPAVVPCPWITGVSAAAGIILLVICRPGPELFLLFGFQVTVLNRAIGIPRMFRPLLYLLPGPFVPVKILHIYIFSVLILFASDLLSDIMMKRRLQADKKYAELRQHADDLAGKFEEQADTADGPGLPRLESLIETYKNSHSLECNIEGNRTSMKFSRPVWNVIVNNAREFFENSARHSGADRITLSFNRYNKFTRIEIRDNGKGCTRLHNGAGLEAMNKRTARAGGSLVVKSLPVFSVIMLFPGEPE